MCLVFLNPPRALRSLTLANVSAANTNCWVVWWGVEAATKASRVANRVEIETSLG